MPAPKSIHPEIVHMCRHRIGRAFEQIHGDLDQLPRQSVPAGKTPRHPIAGVAICSLYEQDHQDACCFINGRKDQIIELLARLLVQANINPFELMPIMAQMIQEQMDEQKKQQGSN
jgi:hypothetical protein